MACDIFCSNMSFDTFSKNDINNGIKRKVIEDNFLSTILRSC